MSTNSNPATGNGGVKTTVFNLIILDESGSMSGVTEQTIAGCNETINVARFAAEQNPDKIRSLVSIYAFQNGGPVTSRYIIKNKNAKDVEHITGKDYSPYGNTPLLDAVGSTLSELKVVSATHEDATGIITIITDGYENSSTQYSWPQVARLISQFKEMGWTVNLIGANIDVDAMAAKMNIDNRMKFAQTKEGTAAMFSGFGAAQCSRMADYASEACDFEDIGERIKARKMKSGSFFKK